MSVPLLRPRAARSATLSILIASGLVLACKDTAQPVLTSDIAWSENACLTPQTGTPPAGLKHPALGLVPVALGSEPFAVAISPAGVTYVTQVLGASAARTDLPTEAFSTPFSVGPFPSQVRMSPGGDFAYVGNQNNPNAGTITVLDVPTNKTLGVATVPAGAILTIGLSPDGKRLFALTDFHGVYILNATSGELMDSIPVTSTGTLLTGVAFHPFSRCMYIAARDNGTVSTVDLRTKKVVQTFTVSGARIQNVAVSRDGATLFATDIQRSKLLVWSLTGESATPQEYPIGTPVNRNAFDVAITPDNSQVYVSTLFDGQIFVLDRVTRNLVGAMSTGGNPRYIAFNDSGTVAVIPNEQGFVSFTAPPDVCGAPPAGVAPPGGSHPSLTSNVTVPLTGTPFAVAISPTGVTYVTQLLAATAVRADLPSTSFSASFPVGALPSQVRMSPDGRTAYVENQDAQTITFLNVANNQVIATVAVSGGSILNMGLSPDGRRLYALTDYAGVQIVDTQTRAVVGAIPAATTGLLLTGVAFHPSAPCMYLAARDEGRITTVNLLTNSVVRSQTVLGGRIQNVAVSRDGALLLATDIERSKLLVRDLTSDGSAFLEYAVGTPESRNAFDVAVTPDNGQVYVSTLADGKVYVFDRATRALLSAVATGGSARYIGFDAMGATAVIANESGWVNFVH